MYLDSIGFFLACKLTAHSLHYLLKSLSLNNQRISLKTKIKISHVSLSSHSREILSTHTSPSLLSPPHPLNNLTRIFPYTSLHPSLLSHTQNYLFSLTLLKRKKTVSFSSPPLSQTLHLPRSPQPSQPPSSFIHHHINRKYIHPDVH